MFMNNRLFLLDVKMYKYIIYLIGMKGSMGKDDIYTSNVNDYIWNHLYMVFLL